MHRVMSFYEHLFFLAFLFEIAIVQAGQVNVTVDDQFGDEKTGLLPIYSPLSQFSQGNTCTSCVIRPDPSLTFNGTWHDSTYYPTTEQPSTITVNFTGTAVYAFFIIANSVPNALVTLTNLSFALDGSHAGSYVHEASSANSLLYNVSAFSAADLANANHVLSMTTAGSGSSVVLFDYLVYSVLSDDSSTDPATSKTTASDTASDPNITATITSSVFPTSGIGNRSQSNSSRNKILFVCILIIIPLILIILFFLYLRYRKRKSLVSDLSLVNSATAPTAAQYNEEDAKYFGLGTGRNNEYTPSRNPGEHTMSAMTLSPPVTPLRTCAVTQTDGSTRPLSDRNRELPLLPSSRKFLQERQANLTQQVQEIRETMGSARLRASTSTNPPVSGPSGISTPPNLSYQTYSLIPVAFQPGDQEAVSAEVDNGNRSDEDEATLRSRITVLEEEVRHLHALQAQLEQLGIPSNGEDLPEYEGPP